MTPTLSNPGHFAHSSGFVPWSGRPVSASTQRNGRALVRGTHGGYHPGIRFRSVPALALSACERRLEPGVAAAGRQSSAVHSRASTTRRWIQYLLARSVGNQRVRQGLLCPQARRPRDARPRLAALRDRILALGGIQAANSYTKVNLSLFGLYPRDYCPSIPPEIMLLPGKLLYQMSSWTRAIIVSLAIVHSNDPQRPVPARL